MHECHKVKKIIIIITSSNTSNFLSNVFLSQIKVVEDLFKALMLIVPLMVWFILLFFLFFGYVCTICCIGSSAYLHQLGDLQALSSVQ